MMFLALVAIAVGAVLLLVKVLTKSERRPHPTTAVAPGDPLDPQVNRMDPPVNRTPVSVPVPPGVEPIRQAPSNRAVMPPKPRWILPGENISISGVTIAGGLFYFGSGLQSLSGYRTEPALVDPRLRIDTPPVGYCGEDLPYWPSYSEISPAARGVFVRWLAEGRADKTISIGIVFIFLYGLERRVLADKQQLSETELRQIRSEVERLISVYGENVSFRKYAVSLLDIIQSDSSRHGRETPPAVTRSWQSPNLALRRGLGGMAVRGEPIPAGWALAWVKSRDDFYERTPATRCVEEFGQLFEIRYEGAHGPGVVVKPNKTPLKAIYRPASASFGGEVSLELTDVPDVTVLKQPIEKFVDLANRCQDELDPFSRFIGRNPQQRKAPAALSLLPAELLSHDRLGSLASIRAFLDSRVVGDEFAIIQFSDLRRSWPELPEAPGRRDSVMIGQCLQRLGFGMEPDIRFGSHAIDPQDPLVVFRQSNGPSTASADYISGTLFAHLGAMLAHADNSVSEHEERRLMQHAAHELNLQPAEVRRLQAYMKWLLAAPPELSGLKKRLEATSAAVRTKLGAFLANLANADGRVTPEEVNLISKMYRLLGLDPDQAFHDIHAAATEPVQVTPPPVDQASGYKIPARREAPVRSVVDLARVQAMQVESDGVAALLREIFVEDETHTPKPVIVSESACLLGLDSAHSGFLEKLTSAVEWPRDAVAALAEEMGLLPDGAIDLVNETAIDRVGERLIEGDDPITINMAIKEELGL